MHLKEKILFKTITLDQLKCWLKITPVVFSKVFKKNGVLDLSKYNIKP